MASTGKKPKKKRAHEKRLRRAAKDRVAARGKAKRASRKGAQQEGLPEKFLRLKKFIHLDLDASRSERIEQLLRHKNAVMILSRTVGAKPRYFLSSSNQLRGLLEETAQPNVQSRRGRDAGQSQGLKLDSVTKTALGKIQPRLHPILAVGATHKRTTAYSKDFSVKTGQAFLHLKNDKPSALIVSSQALGTSFLSATVRNAVVSALPKSALAAAGISLRSPAYVREAGEAKRKSLEANDNAVGEDAHSYFNWALDGEPTISVAEAAPDDAAEFPEGAAPPHIASDEELTAGSRTGAPSRVRPPRSGSRRRAVAEEPDGESVGESAAPPAVFPNIQASDEHPVQGASFRVIVSLDFTRIPRVTGVVDVPSDTEPHEIDVHLLVGRESRWEKLTFQRPRGTISEAVFDGVSAPDLIADEDHSVPDRIIAEICVNFYLAGRWCGEAITLIEVRATEATPKMPFRSDRPAPNPPWRRGLSIAPGTPPPDLTVRIQRTGPMSFAWSMSSPHMNFHSATNELTTSYDSPPFNFIRFKFEKFASAKVDTQKRDFLNSICDEIFRAAPPGFRKAYRSLRVAEKEDKTGRTKLDTILFVSDDPYIPWELMRVADSTVPRSFEPEVLAVRHVVGRWVASDVSELRAALDVRHITVIATDYSGQNVANFPMLPGAKEERDFLTAKPYLAAPVPVRYDDVRNYLYNRGSEVGPAEIIHFSCHGTTDVQDPDEAMLGMEDRPLDEGFKATLAASQEAVAGAGAWRPLVFLNACQAGASGNAFGFVFGWPQAFLEMGATACVAPLWKVVDTNAKEVAKQFYQMVLDAAKEGSPLSIGETLRRIRTKWTSDESLTNLAYVLYGDPTAKLTWTPPS